MADLLSDTMARLIKPNHSQTKSSEFSPSDQWSDAEVIERMKTAPMYPDAVWTTEHGPQSSIFDLCSDTVAKCALDTTLRSEARALDFVRAHTSIPVPKVRRLITSLGYGYLLMEKVEGKRLDKLWPSLSPLQRFLIAWTLRDYICELRNASVIYPRRNVPGPMADSPQRCDGSWLLFGVRPQGPFNSSAELIGYFNTGRMDQKFDDSQPMVLTHGDLCLRNMIMGHDGKIWLVDWGWSGFYPPWCEYLATIGSFKNDNNKALMSWWRYIPLVTGTWMKEKSMLFIGDSLAISWLNRLAAGQT